MFPTHFALKMRSHAYLRKRIPMIDSDSDSNICHLNFEIYFLESEIIGGRPNTFQAVQNLDILKVGVLRTPRRPPPISLYLVKTIDHKKN